MRSCWCSNIAREIVITHMVQTRTETKIEPLVCLMKFNIGQVMKKYLQHKTDSILIDAVDKSLTVRMLQVTIKCSILALKDI